MTDNGAGTARRLWTGTNSSMYHDDQSSSHQLRRVLLLSALLITVVISVDHLVSGRGWLTFRPSNPTHDKAIKPRLHVPSSGVFKILQLTDLHLGEAEDTLWGPEQDRKTWIVLDAVIRAEHPDLLILSGDQLTGNNVDANATTYYRQLGNFLNARHIPWALLFGNHDDMALEVLQENGTITRKKTAKTSRVQLAQVDQSFPLSLTEIGPPELFGISNYVIELFDPRSELALQIYMLDTGGGSLPKQIDASQVKWFTAQREQVDVPAVIFQHIPTRQFAFQPNACAGFNGDGGIDAMDTDAEWVETLHQDSNILWVGVGHNHGNDYCCQYKDDSLLHLCFGRHSSYGGYGNWDRGARAYQLDFTGEAVRWTSWVRLESGEVVDEYDPYREDSHIDASK